MPNTQPLALTSSTNALAHPNRTIVPMSWLYRFYWDHWYHRARRRAWTDPTWAAIERRRFQGAKPGTRHLLDDAHGLTLAEWDTQDQIFDRLNPTPLPIKLHSWFTRHGLRHQLAQLRRFSERGRRGYSHTDVWNLHFWLARVISTATADLIAENPSCPPELSPEQWLAILQQISDGFAAYSVSHDLLSSDADRSTARQQFEAAMLLFTRWFKHLWD